MKLVQTPSPPATELVPAKEPPAHWTKLPSAPRPHGADAWSYGRYLVMSSFWRMPVAVAYGPEKSTAPVPVFHLAISLKRGQRAARAGDDDVKRVLDAFGMSSALELPTKPADVTRQYVLSAV